MTAVAVAEQERFTDSETLGDNDNLDNMDNIVWTEWLGDEIWEAIFARLDTNSLAKCRTICKRFDSIIVGRGLFWKLAQPRFGSKQTPIVKTMHVNEQNNMLIVAFGNSTVCCYELSKFPTCTFLRRNEPERSQSKFAPRADPKRIGSVMSIQSNSQYFVLRLQSKFQLWRFSDLQLASTWTDALDVDLNDRVLVSVERRQLLLWPLDQTELSKESTSNLGLERMPTATAISESEGLSSNVFLAFWNETVAHCREQKGLLTMIRQVSVGSRPTVLTCRPSSSSGSGSVWVGTETDVIELWSSLDAASDSWKVSTLLELYEPAKELLVLPEALLVRSNELIEIDLSCSNNDNGVVCTSADWSSLTSLPALGVYKSFLMYLDASTVVVQALKNLRSARRVSQLHLFNEEIDFGDECKTRFDDLQEWQCESLQGLSNELISQLIEQCDLDQTTWH